MAGNAFGCSLSSLFSISQRAGTSKWRNSTTAWLQNCSAARACSRRFCPYTEKTCYFSRAPDVLSSGRQGLVRKDLGLHGFQIVGLPELVPGAFAPVLRRRAIPQGPWCTFQWPSGPRAHRLGADDRDIKVLIAPRGVKNPALVQEIAPGARGGARPKYRLLLWWPQCQRLAVESCLC